VAPPCFSWSGSMFEHLMPSLSCAPAGPGRTKRWIVRRQISYGAKPILGRVRISLQCAISNLTSTHFDVPGLGLKRGSENVVVVPYATALATMVDPFAATRNRVVGTGRCRWPIWLYEALTIRRCGYRRAASSRLLSFHGASGHDDRQHRDALLNGVMREVSRRPIVLATELLLHERTLMW
jgi:cyclic beta-1,2-glucan synthetase